MHALRRSRLPRGLSLRRLDRPIHQRHRRFAARQVHRLRLLHHRLPVQYSQVQSRDQARFQVHAVRRPCERRPGARLHQGVPYRLPALRQQRRHESTRRAPRQPTPRSLQLSASWRLRSRGRRRHRRHLRPARRHATRNLRWPSEKSQHSVDGEALERSAQVARQRRDDRRPHRSVRPLSPLRSKSSRRGRPGGAQRRAAMSPQEQLLPHGHVQRYNFRERLMHWIAAFSYIYLLLTGLAFWSPWLFWIAVILGGAPVSRMLHPWIGLIFIAGVLQMYSMWASQMDFTAVDRAWFQSVEHYIRNEDEKMPPAGRYNAGQKLLFWGFFLCGILLFLSGLVLWFPEYIPWSLRWLRYIAVLVHASTALLTIGLFLIHVYMGVFAERGALDSVIYGDVTEDFAKRFHPAWYKELVGSAPRRK